jgi:antitoxin MazE
MRRSWFERVTGHWTILDIHFVNWISKGVAMEHFKIAKWGNSLAVRLPSKMVKAMGLKEGDLIDQKIILGGAAIRARLIAEREANKLTPEQAKTVMLEARKRFPKHLRPQDWKIDRNAPDMRG